MQAVFIRFAASLIPLCGLCSVAIIVCAACGPRQVDIDAMKKDIAGMQSELNRISSRQNELCRDVDGLKVISESRQVANRVEPAGTGNFEVPGNLKVVRVPQAADAAHGKKPDYEDATALTKAVSSENSMDPDSLFGKGLGLMNSGDCQKAVSVFGDFLRLYPADRKAPQAAYNIAGCRFGQGEYAVALSDYRLLLANYESSKQAPMAAYRSGVCLLRLGDESGAVAMFRKAKKLDPGDEGATLAEKELLKLK